MRTNRTAEPSVSHSHSQQHLNHCGRGYTFTHKSSEDFVSFISTRCRLSGRSLFYLRSSGGRGPASRRFVSSSNQNQRREREKEEESERKREGKERERERERVRKRERKGAGHVMAVS